MNGTEINIRIGIEYVNDGLTWLAITGDIPHVPLVEQMTRSLLALPQVDAGWPGFP